MLKRIIKILTLRTDPLDPVHHCQVYKKVGCVHVDGFLCDMKTCNIEVVQHITPNSTKEVRPNVWSGIDYET
jgi:hypothetical protein